MSELTLPENTRNMGWNTYGMGLEAVGRDGAPEPMPIPSPGPGQMLVRVDAVGLCFSDVKLIRLGGDHPKLYGRDLSVEPTRLGHEASVTVIEVGEELADTYQPGQRLAIQPDIHQDGMSTAYGYTIPGGLIQYHLIGPEVLDGDEGAYVIPVTDEIGYASAALSEPWACVEAAYTQRRRLSPLDGGSRWIIADPSNETEYDFGASLSAAGSIVATGASDALKAQITAAAGDVAVSFEDEISAADVAAFGERHTGEDGFDDIIMLAPSSAELVTEVAKLIAFRGTMNMVADTALDGEPDIDFGRLHYHYTAYVGTNGTAIEAAYGEDRNRADFRPGGVAAYVGAAGPMGQMHIQRSIEMEDGPDTLVCIDLDQDRMQVLIDTLTPLADAKGKKMVIVDPNKDDARTIIDGLTDGRGADDVIVSVPVAVVMSDAGKLMADDGMLVFFAGIANGTYGPLDMSQVYLSNAQFTGTSGSSVADQASVIEKAIAGSLTPSLNLAAIGGIEAGQDGIKAVMEGTFAGKTLIFPNVSGVPLSSLKGLADVAPDVYEKLGPNGEWTREAEDTLIANYPAPPK